MDHNQTIKIENLTIKIDGIELKRVEIAEYLEIFIDEKLLWDAHINHIIIKLLKFYGILYKIKNFMPPSIMKKIYFALIHPHIIYGIELYANTHEKYLDPLVELNNKILRIAQI